MNECVVGELALISFCSPVLPPPASYTLPCCQMLRLFAIKWQCLRCYQSSAAPRGTPGIYLNLQSVVYIVFVWRRRQQKTTVNRNGLSDYDRLATQPDKTRQYGFSLFALFSWYRPKNLRCEWVSLAIFNSRETQNGVSKVKRTLGFENPRFRPY